MTRISAPELGELLDSDASIVVLDVRWSLAAPDGRAAYEAGHIPDAVYVDLEADLSDHTITGCRMLGNRSQRPTIFNPVSL
ncbi:hypothetical protein [Rhodococcus koreensis]|uniref:hypothetical protein n=1 Tax=Rhodococcus koreensis TaxID=99653 RepID=UPI0036723484